MGRYIDSILLKNKNIIVTGACGLLGKEFCKGIAELGGNIIVADINADFARQFAVRLGEEYGIKAESFPLDITSEESINNMIEYLLSKLDNIDGLVNNAYPRNNAWGTLFENILFEDWRENVDMHLNGYFNVTQKVAKMMMKQKSGSIINMGSIYGNLGPDFRIYEGTQMTMPAEYSAIKGGIINFTRYLSTYLSKYNIRVNSISPGGIYNNQPKKFVDNYIEKTPLGRMGKPEDIVGGIVYLLSDSSQYVTGQNIVIDGGWSVW